MQQLSNKELIEYYTAILEEPENISNHNTPFRYSKGNLTRHSPQLLHELLPIIDRYTDDSRSVLFHLIEKYQTDDDIRFALKTQPLLSGFSYADTASVLQSLKSYEAEGMLTEADVEAVRSNADQLIALHLVVYMIRVIMPADLLTGDHAENYPLDTSRHFIGKRLLHFIKDRELLPLVLEYANKVDTITDMIRQQRAVDVPSLRFILEGGAPSLSDGAL
jgi:hypothetical protein